MAAASDHDALGMPEEAAPPVLVLSTKFARSWPEHESDSTPVAYRSLGDALTTRYNSDAHFAAYSNPEIARRLAGDALVRLAADGGDAAMCFFVGDVDGQDHVATDAWREETRAKFATLALSHPGIFSWESAGGFKFIYRLPEPVRLRSDEDAEAWKLGYTRRCVHLARVFALPNIDTSCADWAHLFRCPDVVRKGKRGTFPTKGDPYAVGVWNFEPDTTIEDDLAFARACHAAALGEKANGFTNWSRAIKALEKAVGGASKKAPGRSGAKSPRQGAVAGDANGQTYGIARGLEGGMHSLDKRILRARKMMQSSAPSIAGQGGDTALWNVANLAVRGFCLPDEHAEEIVDEYNATRCDPPWSDDRLEHKIREARDASEMPWGKYLDEKPKLALAPPANGEAPTGDTAPPASGERRLAERRDGGDRRGGDRPDILLSHELHELIDAATEALANAPDVNLYARDNMLVQVLSADDRTKRNDAGAPVVRPVQLATVREALTRAACFKSYDKREKTWRPTTPPDAVTQGLLCRGEWEGIPRLTGVLETPFLKPGGTIAQTPGYDEDTGYLLVTRDAFLDVPDHPTRDDARRAMATLRDVFVDFPFASEASRDLPIAASLTLLSRPALGDANTPAFVFDANTRGTGKSLLVDLICLMATGRVAPKTGYPYDDAEMHKLLGSAARDAVSIVGFDNIEAPFGGGDLDRFLTSQGSVSLRILGQSQTQTCIWRAVFFATGNNVAVKADTGRRTLICTQDTQLERPETREGFRHPDLRAYVKAHRAELVRCGLTILRAHALANEPSAVKPLGSFEAWSRTVASAIVWAGGANPIDALADTTSMADPAKDALRILLEHFHLIDYLGNGITAREIVAKLYPGPMAHQDPELDVLREAVEGLCKASAKTLTGQALAYKLRSHQKRVVGGRRLEPIPGRSNTVKWAVRTVGGELGSKADQRPAPARGGDGASLGGDPHQEKTHKSAGIGECGGDGGDKTNPSRDKMAVGSISSHHHGAATSGAPSGGNGHHPHHSSKNIEKIDGSVVGIPTIDADEPGDITV